MIIRKKKFKEIITQCIILTSKQCGKNLRMKDIASIKNKLAK